MKPCVLRSYRLWQRLFLCMMSIALLGATGPLSAAPGGRKLLKLELSADRRTAEVEVPAGYGSVILQRFHREGGWEKIATKKAVSGVVKFRLPAAGKDVRWRAIGRFSNEAASHGKFPAGFYKGGNSFGPTKARSSGVGVFKALTNAGDAGVVGEVPVEADIWKTDGGTVYFFNQLRGLQVLDVSNPADPRLTASLRLPAVGEDLYLLPGSGEVRYLVLLTQKSSGDEGPMMRINLVKVEAGKAEITHRQDVPGQLSDSRMVGNRLILATTEWNWDPIALDSGMTETTTSHLSQWVIAPGRAPRAAAEFTIDGDYPLISAGADWLAVAVTPPGEWRFSEVSVFSLGKSGLIRLTPKPIRTAGVVADKFKMQWSKNVLTTISERNRGKRDWSPTTVLETFRVWGPDVVVPAVVTDGVQLGTLELAKGESLFATRFAGDKAYVVTFLQTDPLWVVDLSDPKKPVVAGNIEVPGWSSHLEPIGDLLLAIGWESNTPVASLFDVADPTAPKRLSRLELGSSGTYSEAFWDEQALKVLPDAGLAMIPLTSYDEGSGTANSVVRLLDLDLTGGELKLRGTISHDFDARRADVMGTAVVSISQRVLVAADVTDRDKPEILSEVSLAWPVDRVLDAGTHMLQIEAGNHYGYGRATLRVSPADAPEAVLSETDLGDGTVCAADFRDGKLFILREIPSPQTMWYRSPITGESSGKAVLDVYDGSSLPTISKLGSCSMRLRPGMRIATDRLLWPRSNRPTVVLDAMSSFWFGWDDPIMKDPPLLLKTGANFKKADSSIVVDRFPFWRPRKAPRLLVFDVTQADAPSVGEPVVVGTVETVPNDFYQAADGLVVIGASDWKNEANGKTFGAGESLQSAYVAEIPASGEPIVRPGIDLPGELFAVSELDHAGFLAFTRNFDSGNAPALKVSACDGFDAFEIAGLDENAGLAATAGGRRLFVAKAGGVERHRLGDDGSFVAEPKLEIGWKPQSLRWTKGVLLGSKWNALFAAEPTADAADTWRFPTWSLWLDHVAVASDGDLLVPFGDYGAERLDRGN